MSLSAAALLVTVVSILTNRILAVGVGLWFRLPGTLLLGLLMMLDIVQIPFFYRLYQHGFRMLDGIPTFRKVLKRDWSLTPVGRWAAPLGGLGVMLVSALPTLGGGIWSATFMAYGLRLERRAGYAWIILGSLLSYLTLYWILDTLIRTARFFMS